MLGLGLALVLAGCGDGGAGATDGGTDGELPSDAGAGGSGTNEDLERTARDQFEAFLGADNETYFDLLSAACRDLGFAAVAGHLDGRRFTAGLGGVDITALSVSDVGIDGNASTADVTLTIDGPGGDQFRETLPHRWTFEDGGWRMDDCADFQEAQGGLEGVGMDRIAPLGLGGVADVNGWLISLSFVELDAEDFVLEIGGDPAADGNQHVYAQVGITYNGAEASITVGDELAFALVSGDQVYGEDTSCDTGDPNLFLDPTTEVGPGELVGNPLVCREIDSEHVTDLLLRVTHVPTGDEWWFDLGG